MREVALLTAPPSSVKIATVKRDHKSSPEGGRGTRHAASAPFHHKAKSAKSKSPVADVPTEVLLSNHESKRRVPRSHKGKLVKRLGKHLFVVDPTNVPSPARLTSTMRDVLDRCGLEDEALVRRFLTPALEAMESKFFVLSGGQGAGSYLEQRDTISWGARLRALDMAFQLKGSYAPRTAQVDVNAQISIADAIREARQRAAALPSRTIDAQVTSEAVNVTQE